MNSSPKISICIPAYNEEHRIGETLEYYLRECPQEISFIIVLNGCTDNTAAVVREVSAGALERVHMIDIPEACGKGAAIIRGWKYVLEHSEAGLLGFVDADGATDPSEYMKLIDTVGSFDGAIASRFIAGSKVVERQSLLRTIMSRGFIAVVKTIFWMPFRDTQCGAKVFRRDAVTSIIDSIQETGMVFDVELLWRLHKRGASIVEVPTIWTDKPGSQALGSHTQFIHEAFRMFAALIRLRFR